MITPEGWFDWMRPDPGPREKLYGEPYSAEVFIPHSAVGDNYSSWRDGRLLNMDREPSRAFTDMAAASLTGWINKREEDGCFQHYSIFDAGWGSGSAGINTRTIAFENQGGVDQPETVSEKLTEYQLECCARILTDLSAFFGRPDDYWRRPTGDSDLSATLYEHIECVRFGSKPTARPSGRIPWPKILEALGQGVPVLPIDPPPVAAPAAETYVIVSGDTLTSLARAWGCTVADIVALNSIDDPDQIQIGQVLVIPARN